MKYLTLIGAGLMRRPLRSVLTVLAVAVAFLLFGVMHGVVTSFDRALDLMSDARLRVMSRAADSQIIADAATLMSVSNRSVYSALTAVVPDDAFAGFKQALEGDPQLVVEVTRAADYYEEQAQAAAGVMGFVAYVVSGIMALGALFGAANTMYTAVAGRTREIATLRALGFGAGAVVASVLVEALLLALLGALLGAAFSWALFGGMQFSGGGQLAAVAVELEVGLPVVAVGVAWAATIGLFAGMLPALRAARLPVAEGLRIEA